MDRDRTARASPARPRPPQIRYAAPPTVPAHSASSVAEQPLTLKVMRLSKPPFHLHSPILVEPDDHAFGMTARPPSHTLLPSSHASSAPGLYGVTDILTLPRHLGNVYLGEEFVSYISIFNHTEAEVTKVIIKAELEVKSNQPRTVLLDLSNSPIEQFGPGKSNDFVVHQKMTEAGTHILVCTASYIKHGFDRRSFRKMFKFNVVDPIKLKHRVSYVDNNVLVEVQMINASTTGLLCEEVKFKPTSKFLCADLSLHSPAPSSSSAPPLDTALLYLKPGCVRNYLYKLRPKKRSKNAPQLTTKEQDPKRKPGTPAPTPRKLLPGEPDVVGKMEIKWRSSLGELGSRKIALSRKAPVEPEIELEVVDVPPQILLEKAFRIKCRITNKREQTVKLTLFVARHKGSGVVPVGLSGVILGEIAPAQSITLDVDFFPIWPGIQRIIGMRVKDEKNQEFFFPVVDVLVQEVEAEKYRNPKKEEANGDQEVKPAEEVRESLDLIDLSKTTDLEGLGLEESVLVEESTMLEEAVMEEESLTEEPVQAEGASAREEENKLDAEAPKENGVAEDTQSQRSSDEIDRREAESLSGEEKKEIPAAAMDTVDVDLNASTVLSEEPSRKSLDEVRENGGNSSEENVSLGGDGEETREETA